MFLGKNKAMRKYTIHNKLEANDMINAIESREQQLSSQVQSIGGGESLHKIQSEMNRLSIAKDRFRKIVEGRGSSSSYDKYNGLL